MPTSPRRSKLSSFVVALGLFGALGAVPTVAEASSQATQKLGTRALRAGASGPDVRELQKLLRRVGFDLGPADGRFGTSTVSAVKRFQAARALEPSGTVGKVTVVALRDAARSGATKNLATGGIDPSGPSSSRSLGDRIPVRQGMSGHDVKVLQDFLRRVGESVTVDGEFGRGTTTAVKHFETVNELDVDGLVDANDIAVLRGQAAAGPSARSAPEPAPLAPGDQAKVGPDGLAVAPANAPEAVKAIIAAGNAIAKKPYIYGGGHSGWDPANGYDCSGSVSYALHGASLLDAPMASGGFMGKWATSGVGRWVTVYANEGHMYMVVAGIRYDTSGAKQDGSRWHASLRPTKGYVVSHPAGL